MMRMKRTAPAWWASPKSLLHSIIHVAIPSFLTAFFIIKCMGSLEYVNTNTHDLQKPNFFLHTSSSLLNPKASLILNKAHVEGTGALASLFASSRRAASGYGARIRANKKSHIDKIRDWDWQRQNWLAQNAGFADGHGRSQPNVLLVTGSSPKPCRDPRGDHLLLRFIKNKADYCRLHGIHLFHSMALLNNVMTDCWSKLPLLRTLMLSHPEMEWIWWMDSDAAITDMTFELPLKKYDQYNFVLHGWNEQVYNKKSWVGLNAGVFLIRNCQWSLDFMDAWGAFGEDKSVRDELGIFFSAFLTNRPVFEGDDQAALVYILSTQKEVWQEKVLLENSYCLHGYWEIIVDRYEKIRESTPAGYGDDRWPFVTHFVGCKPCGDDAVNERCAKQMERAFNFADNQVMQQYGYEHKHLATSELVRVAKNESE